MRDMVIHDRAVRHFCTFRVEDRLYGFVLSEVREVSTGLAITPVPHAPPAVRGLANLRSRIYLVLDLRPILGYEPAEATPDSRLVILRPSVAESTAVLVDRGGDIVTARDSDIEPGAGHAAALAAPAGAPADVPAAVSAGVCKLENELMVILDPVAIASEIARQIR